MLSNGNSNCDDILNVKRGQIRLLRPPWWDELNDVNEVDATHSYPPSNNKRPYYGNNNRGSSGQSTAIMYSNSAVTPSSNRNHSVVEVGNRLKYPTKPDHTLQLHQVLPTIKVCTPELFNLS